MAVTFSLLFKPVAVLPQDRYLARFVSLVALRGADYR